MLNKVKDVISTVEEKAQNFMDDHPVITLGAMWGSYLTVVAFAGKYYHDRAIETRELAKAIKEANQIIASQK